MTKLSGAFLFSLVVAALAGTTWLAGTTLLEKPSQGAPDKDLFPTNSSPIAISHDDRFVWAVNPDAGSLVTLALDVTGQVDFVSQTASGATLSVGCTPDT